MSLEDVQYIVWGFVLYLCFYWQSRMIVIIKEFLK